jgi:hypothetical protein
MPCVELVEAAADSDADVTVRYGAVPRDLPGATHSGVRYQAAPGQALLRVDGVARFLVRDGRDIVIDRDAGAGDDDVRLFLLGAALGALLQQRGKLVLKGSVVGIDDGCVLFLGRSGAGKSTLAAALVKRGYRGLSDDACALTIDEDGTPFALPIAPQANLWPDSLQRLGLDAIGLRRVRPSLEKRAWSFPGPRSHERVPVKGVFVLTQVQTATTLESRSIRGPAKIRLLREFPYGGSSWHGREQDVLHFRQVAHLCSRLAVTLIVRPERPFLLDELASLVEGMVRA